MADRRRAFGPMLALSVGLGFLLYLHGVSYMLDHPAGDGLFMLELSLSGGYAGMVMPLICALPFGNGFCRDVHTGWAGMIIFRTGKRRYFLSKIMACCLSGGLSAALSMGLFAGFAHLVYPTDFSTPAMMELTNLQSLLKIPEAGGYALYYLARMALVFLSGAFWAMCALAFSAFFPYASLAMVCPMVLWRAFMALGEMGALPAFFNPALLEGGYVAMEAGPMLLWALLLYGALIFLAALLFWRRGKRRLYYGR